MSGAGARPTVGLFGGSFDPIHLGHLIVAQTALETLGLAELRFVPAREQPFKAGRHRAGAEARAHMVSLAIAGEPRFRLERAELDRQGPSYTVETLRTIGEREPATSLVLLVGADAARDLSHWREADQLHRLADLVILARPGAVPPELPWPHRVLPVPAIEISATDVRDRVGRGLSVSYLVPGPVAEFIAAHGLYR